MYSQIPSLLSSLNPPRLRLSPAYLPLGPHRYSLPGHPVFPPSVQELDLYRLALKNSARHAKIMHIKAWKFLISGGSAGEKHSDFFDLLVV